MQIELPAKTQYEADLQKMQMENVIKELDVHTATGIGPQIEVRQVKKDGRFFLELTRVFEF